MPEAFADHVRAEIRAELARQGVTRDALAERLGIATQALRRRLSGEVGLELEEVEAIAAALGVPIGKFTDRASVA